MAQTNRVIIHHEGGGKPRDEWDAIDAERYSIEIGLTRIEVRNAPVNSFITDGTIGHSLQLVLSGNRMTYEVTDNDLVLIGQACAYAEAHDWIPAPAQRACQFHGDTAATACPGDKTRERRSDIYAVVRGTGTPPAPDPEVDEVTVLNERLPGAKDGKPGNLYVGLPYGFKACRVDFWLDLPSDQGASLWGAQLYEGGATAVGLWNAGKLWELWLPGKKRSNASVALDPNTKVCALRLQNKSETSVPVLVTVTVT